jgi:hypothetical protein
VNARYFGARHTTHVGVDFFHLVRKEPIGKTRASDLLVCSNCRVTWLWVQPMHESSNKYRVLCPLHCYRREAVSDHGSCVLPAMLYRCLSLQRNSIQRISRYNACYNGNGPCAIETPLNTTNSLLYITNFFQSLTNRCGRLLSKFCLVCPVRASCLLPSAKRGPHSRNGTLLS